MGSGSFIPRARTLRFGAQKDHKTAIKAEHSPFQDACSLVLLIWISNKNGDLRDRELCRFSPWISMVINWNTFPSVDCAPPHAVSVRNNYGLKREKQRTLTGHIESELVITVEREVHGLR